MSSLQGHTSAGARQFVPARSFDSFSLHCSDALMLLLFYLQCLSAQGILGAIPYRRNLLSRWHWSGLFYSRASEAGKGHACLLLACFSASQPSIANAFPQASQAPSRAGLRCWVASELVKNKGVFAGAQKPEEPRPGSSTAQLTQEALVMGASRSDQAMAGTKRRRIDASVHTSG